MKYLTQNFLFRFYYRQNELERVMALSCLFSFAMVISRVVYTDQTLFVFLPWNLFLAIIPYVFSKLLVRQKLGKQSLILASLAWVLFVPNAFYIITDLFHLGKNDGSIPLWFDLALLLSFAWNGLLFGILSVRHMEKMFEKVFNRELGLLFLLPVMFLNGLGVYIGRYLRFNSWDVITNPLQLAADMLYLFLHPVQNRFDWSMIVCYCLLMTLIYLAFKKLAHVLK